MSCILHAASCMKGVRLLNYYREGSDRVRHAEESSRAAVYRVQDEQDSHDSFCCGSGSDPLEKCGSRSDPLGKIRAKLKKCGSRSDPLGKTQIQICILSQI